MTHVTTQLLTGQITVHPSEEFGTVEPIHIDMYADVEGKNVTVKIGWEVAGQIATTDKTVPTFVIKNILSGKMNPMDLMKLIK